MKAPEDTIAAIATAPGRGGVGVIRISGARLETMAEVLCGKKPPPRLATLASIRADDNSIIDKGLLLFFPAPNSYTGEDVLEIHGHGGPVVLQMVLQQCLQAGARLAQPGEFTRRAYLNGKLDLAQAEAVADLIEAETTSAARSAARSLQGEFSRQIEELVSQLTQLRARIESSFDFPEEDIDDLIEGEVFERIERIENQLERVFERARQGRLLQNGLQVVFAGAPNVGKSSLLNCLAGDDLAIVSPVPGTTRDVVRGVLQIEGIPLHIIDTAGLHETEDVVEKIGIRRTWNEIAQADVVVFLTDVRKGWGAEEKEILDKLPKDRARITLYNKIDLTGQRAESREKTGGTEIFLSAKTGDGVSLLREALLKIAGWHPAEDVFIARERHLQALAKAHQYVRAARTHRVQLELLAEDLRRAQQALSEVTGAYTADDLLGEIFGQFCIGK